MEITSGLVAKTGAGLAALGIGGTGIYLANSYLNNSISKYEWALINFLEGEDHDIVFDVKKGEDEKQDLTDSDIAFTDGQPQKVTVSAIVKVSGTGGSNFKKKSGDAQLDDKEMEEIKKLNNGSWNWKCKLTFSKEENETLKTIKSDYKNRIFQKDNKGLFGILKQNLSNYTDTTGTWTKNELKKVKMDFVHKCGEARGISKNKEINKKESAEDLTIEVETFAFEKDGTNGSTELKPKDIHKFDHWFPAEYSTKK